MALLTRTLALLTLLAAAACSPKPAPPPGVTVDGAWIRATQPGAKNAAGYAVLTNTGSKPDRLLSVASPAASTAMLHRSMTVDGMAKMQAVAALELPPGKAVPLAPGGHHIMLVGLAGPLAAGERALVSLTFEHAGTVTLPFPVSAAAPDPQEHGH